MIPHATAPGRIFLFKREFTDAFDLRKAIGRSFPLCLVNVLDANEDGLRTACAVVRSNRHASGLVLVEQEHRDANSNLRIGSIREAPELSSLPLIVLGDGEDPLAVQHAYEDGADGLVPLGEAADFVRAGETLVELWDHLQLAKSA